MLWGLPTVMDQNWAAAASTAKEVLGFNEPDLTYEQSSNMLPEAAALGYKNYILPAAGSARIGGPGVLWNNWNSVSSGSFILYFPCIHPSIHSSTQTPLI